MSLKESLPHIWIIDLLADKQMIHYYHSLLSIDETLRASRFRFEKDFETYVITRACTRIVLSNYVFTRPEAIEFDYSAYGKPGVRHPETDLNFNISHSHQLALLGLSRDALIGVDIELIKFDKELESVANKFFSTAEILEFKGLSDAEKPLGFFNGWTRKESFIKALGHGLSFPLKEFDVSLAPGKPVILKKTHFDTKEKEMWTIGDINLPAGYVGAYAIRKQDCICQISQFVHPSA